MAQKIVAFSGMPASGKDTVTDRLCTLHPSFVPFQKYRAVGAEDSIKDTYCNVSKEEFEAMIRRGEFLQYHGRYGRYYGIAEKTLAGLLQQDQIPIIHIGRIENFYTLRDRLPAFEQKYQMKTEIVHILLWETKEILGERIVRRDQTDQEIAKRRAAMEQEFDDNIKMMRNNERPYTLVIRNSEVDASCALIADYVSDPSGQPDGYDAFFRYLHQIG